MSDQFAFYVVLFGIAVLVVFKLLSRGNYEESFFLTAGTYLVGQDIPPGKGDLIATGGAGSFCVRNKHLKDWTIGNPIGGGSDFEPKRFRNLALNRGDILEVNGTATLMISPPKPIRKIKDETLGPGTYRFAVDVPAGKYDLEIVKGDGDVLLVEVGKDDYIFYQDMSASNPIKADSFKNVTCTCEHELWVSGSLEIKLKHSEHQPLILRKII